MQKDLLLKDVNQQLSGKEFDNCSFYRLDEPRTYLCIHKADCWEKSFIVFQKDDEIRVMKGETYEWLDSVTTNRGEMAKWFGAEYGQLINGTEIHSVNVNEKLKNAVSKCLEEINSK
uniref:hypothetical protein n=1 Tax=Prevotella sp. TaxID=59823 RepID=UPI0026DF2AC1|nr:hypothetical protein [uncultured Prevotella sp.]